MIYYYLILMITIHLQYFFNKIFSWEMIHEQYNKKLLAKSPFILTKSKCN